VTDCRCFYAAAADGSYDEPTIYRCQLDDLPGLYDEQQSGSPSNFWPDDHSWFIWTSPDLWGTKVSGPLDLIHALRADEQLEVVPPRC
jgi:hypothetical protein